jgi:hypothetical protein
MVTNVSRVGACHGRLCSPFPLSSGRGDKVYPGFAGLPKYGVRPLSSTCPIVDVSFMARLSQLCGSCGVCIKARYPIARQSRLVNVSAIAIPSLLGAHVAAHRNSDVTALSRNWFRCVLLLSKVETVSFSFRSDFGICGVILDSSATSSCALSIVERRQSETSRAFLRCSTQLGRCDPRIWP